MIGLGLMVFVAALVARPIHYVLVELTRSK